MELTIFFSDSIMFCGRKVCNEFFKFISFEYCTYLYGMRTVLSASCFTECVQSDYIRNHEMDHHVVCACVKWYRKPKEHQRIVTESKLNWCRINLTQRNESVCVCDVRHRPIDLHAKDDYCCYCCRIAKRVQHLRIDHIGHCSSACSSYVFSFFHLSVTRLQHSHLFPSFLFRWSFSSSSSSARFIHKLVVRYM